LIPAAGHAAAFMLLQSEALYAVALYTAAVRGTFTIAVSGQTIKLTDRVLVL